VHRRHLRLLIAVNAAVIVAVVCAAVVLARSGGDPAPRTGPVPARLAAHAFDGARAWALLEHQVRLGPRPAGSPALRGLARYLRARLPHGRIEPVAGGLQNVVGSIPGRAPAILVAAHYDTKAIPGFVGANDGAGGTAAVLEIARALRAGPRPAGARRIDFALFDGEEATDDGRPFAATGLRGSTAYARRHGREVGRMILLDFVAGKDLRIRREASSDERLWAALRTAARQVGAGEVFPAGTGDAIEDDHTPFRSIGIPAIDLIQWPYACWHRACDDLSAVSPRSLDAVGETVVRLVRTLART
jgi:hypothetical protein